MASPQPESEIDTDVLPLLSDQMAAPNCPLGPIRPTGFKKIPPLDEHEAEVPSILHFKNLR